MKIKRYTAPDMRTAMRQVREDQGPDAVILSSKRIGDVVEIVAAVDYDESLIHQASRVDRFPTPPVQSPEAAPAPPVEPAAPPAADREAAQSARPRRKTENIISARLLRRSHDGGQTETAPPAKPAAARTTPPAAAPEAASRDKVIWTQDPHIKRIQTEIRQMRRTMESQLGSMVWRDWTEKQPHRAKAVNQLSELGIDRTIACRIARDLPDANAAERPPNPASLLCRDVPVTDDDPVLKGGVIALVGPTGVGKTTTLAKLAARYADKFDLRDIALVTTDCFRIGAREQLFTYGQLLGVPVFTAQNRDELEQVLAKLSQRKLVLIDTAGMGPRDTRLAAQFSVLEAARASLRTYLVLAANAQPADLQDVVKQFRATPLSGAILTKVDEAARLGGALSTVIRHKLPVAYITDGQKVPEDIHRERPDQLVLRAIRVVRERPDARELPIEEAINACA